MVYNYREWLSLILFPSQCRLCGVTTGTALKLCPRCLADSPWIRHACQQCSAPLPVHADDSHCGHCQKRPPAFDATTALFHYRPPVDYLIKQLKFANELAIIPLLSALLSARLTTRAAPLPSLLVPVPLHQIRLRERGFNQATELARRVGRELGIRSDHRLCTRNRDTRPQSLPHDISFLGFLRRLCCFCNKDDQSLSFGLYSHYAMFCLVPFAFVCVRLCTFLHILFFGDRFFCFSI